LLSNEFRGDSMSASLLLTIICAAIFIQFLVGIAIAMWRRSRGTSSAVADVPLALPISSEAWAGWRDFRVLSRQFEDRAQTQCSFRLEPVDHSPLPAFLPGQFLTFALPVAGQTLTRCYSLSDAPNESNYRITVKRVLAPPGRPELPPGACSRFLHEQLQVGHIVKVKAPAGHFVVESESKVPIVLIAGGIGITPLLSMLRGGLAANPKPMTHLYYGVRNGAEQAFKEELGVLARLNPGLRVNMVFSQPDQDDILGRDFQHSGHIDIQLLRKTLPAGRHRFYLCGPSAMMASLVPALEEWGVLSDDIHHEAFGPASVRPTSARQVLPSWGADESHSSTSIAIRFRSSARTLAWDGKDANLLDFAERHDLSLKSGCRSGSCGACEVKLLSGTVRYSDKPDHEITPGHCLLCVGFPESPLEIEA
jgi:uncharacterized protein